ncbi:MAG: hypothetical protein HY286_16925 [Planctomycetes bacterium]|nr:hypothetical protein [Planctomycetota bacterium]
MRSIVGVVIGILIGAGIFIVGEAAMILTLLLVGAVKPKHGLPFAWPDAIVYVVGGILVLCLIVISFKIGARVAREFGAK